VTLSACRSATVVSPAKTAEPIAMPFELRTRADPRNPVLDGVQIPWEEAILRGEGRPIAKYRAFCDELCKTAEPIEMPFGLWT